MDLTYDACACLLCVGNVGPEQQSFPVTSSDCRAVVTVGSGHFDRRQGSGIPTNVVRRHVNNNAIAFDLATTLRGKLIDTVDASVKIESSLQHCDSRVMTGRYPLRP